MRLVITGGVLEAEIKDNPLDGIRRQLAAIAQSNKSAIDNVNTRVESIIAKSDDKVRSIKDDLINRIGLLKGSEQEIAQLKNRISDALKERDGKIQKLTNDIRLKDDTVSQVEHDIEALREHIDRISQAKDDKIASLYNEMDNLGKQDDGEIAELKSLIISITKDMANLMSSSDIAAIKDQIRKSSEDNKSLIDRINEKIDRIASQKQERINKLRGEITRINESHKQNISDMKVKIVSRKPSVKQIDAPDDTGGKTTHTNYKQFDKLNAKPRMPI